MKDATDITIVLDRSGSMATTKSDVIGGFNRFVQDQKAVPGECRLTLVQFDSQDPYEVVRDAVPITDVQLLDDATFVPRANTPLYDAGLDAGDVITSLDGKAVATTADLTAIVASHKPGDKVSVSYASVTGARTATIRTFRRTS